MADFPTAKTNAVDNVTDVLAKHINNLENKVGIDNSTDTSSLDYKVHTLQSALPSGAIVGTTDTQTLSGKTLTSPLFEGVWNGWIDAKETWTYVSTDDPTGVFKVNADVTGKYSPAMRIKMTNGGNTIYGIITKVGTYGGDQSGYTYITFLHEIDPADNLALHLMANSAITANYYSTQKAPLGFPLQKEKWEILYGIISTGAGNYKDGSGLAQIGSLQVDIPIGNWELSYLTNPYLTTTSGSYDYSAMSCNIGISSATDSFSSGYLQSTINLKTNSSSSVGDQRGIFSVEVSKSISISITSKTTYYLIGQAFGDNSAYVRLFANIGGTGWIRAVCSYL